MSEFKRGALVMLKSGSGAMVVVGCPASDVVEVCWMHMEKGILTARVHSCALKAITIAGRKSVAKAK
jgi:uncharacterized protein YodC (DUF2158 family)